jgi:hypothetical protein
MMRDKDDNLFVVCGDQVAGVRNGLGDVGVAILVAVVCRRQCDRINMVPPTFLRQCGEWGFRGRS